MRKPLHEKDCATAYILWEFENNYKPITTRIVYQIRVEAKVFSLKNGNLEWITTTKPITTIV